MSDVERGFHLISKEERQRSVDAIIGYFHTERSEEIGVVAAEELLEFFLSNVAPAIYNRALGDAETKTKELLDELAFKFTELKRN